MAWFGATEMYASSMKCPIDQKTNEFSYTYSEVCEWKEYSIAAENKLFAREEAFLSRRILVCVSKICEQFPQFSSMLFLDFCEDGGEPKSFMELLSSTIRNLSYYVRLDWRNAFRIAVFQIFDIFFYRKMLQMFRASLKVHAYC